ncbi:hypothetical protein FA95DRAFT_1560101 [Auriscalpium vulgare]|uniref:Uncharacterized protein n=1 Tax=Auriscalpium vulgare TaxID=40419 RepID=A0ACB8RQL9_9AGAM|nr:hypothetical protein FA95DRAFT_1560101 [Auriscalpium vulgare]
MDVIGLVLTVLGILGMAAHVQGLLPAAKIVILSQTLALTNSLLLLVEEFGNATIANEYIDRYNEAELQFFRLRIEANEAHGFFAQVRVAIFDRLAWKLEDLHRNIDAVRRDVEMALDSLYLSNNVADENEAAMTLRPGTADVMEVEIAPSEEGDITELSVGELEARFGVGPMLMLGVGEIILSTGGNAGAAAASPEDESEV